MRVMLFSMIAFSALILSGCGTAVMPEVSGISADRSLQTIHVQAVSADSNGIIQETSCSVKDTSGQRYYVIGNPGKVSVPKDKGSLTITCHKVGYQQSKMGTSDNYNAWASGKIAFWSGSTVDSESGAVVKYPSYLTIVMSKE